MVELSVAGSRGKRMSGKKTPAMDESERAAQRQVNDLESILFFSLLFFIFYFYFLAFSPHAEQSLVGICHGGHK